MGKLVAVLCSFICVAALRTAAEEPKMLRITAEPLCPGTISPFQYGQFVEHLCDLVPAMWAEKLYDGSFEGLRPYAVVFLKETDFKEKPWHPSGATNRGKYTLDKSTKISGEVSQKIEVTGGAPCTLGICQDGLAVDPADPCAFSCFMKQQGVAGPVTVKVHVENKVLASCQFQPNEDWQKLRAKLTFSAGATDATLTISLRGPGVLWLDNASLMPESAVGGWRRDVVEALRAAKPGIIRYGGSQVKGNFDWRITLGDPDLRKPFTAWGGLQPTGPGLEEIVQFCRLVDAEPLICVRFENNAPQEAAAQVEYFNGSVETPMGALRSKNGHPEPYKVKYWQVGNEVDGADYAARLPALCEAMKKADPSILLMSSYPSEAVISNAREYLDFVCPHHYGHGGDADFVALTRMIEKCSQGRKIKIGVTEWNNTAGDFGPGRAKLWGLENALYCSRYHNCLHRHCDMVEIANRSNLINSFCSGFIQTDRYRLYKTPTYYAQQLYAVHAGAHPLRVEGVIGGGLDLSATVSADKEKVILFVVNSSLNNVARELDFSAFGKAGQEVRTGTVADREQAGEPDVANSFGDPERVATRPGTFKASSPKFECVFPALSLTVLEWKVQG